MSDESSDVTVAGSNLRLLVHIAYGLFALGFLTSGFLGIATLASVVLIYIKRGDAAGTVYARHFDWLLRTFWWSVLWLLLSVILTHIVIGWLGVLAAVVWALYRVIKGWLAYFDGTDPSATA